jgi:hypothetical protein
VSCPVPGTFGGLDDGAPVDNVRRVCNVLAAAQQSFDPCVSAEAPHGFLNATMPGRSRALRTQPAWSPVLALLDATLRIGWNPGRVLWCVKRETSLDHDFTRNRRWEWASRHAESQIAELRIEICLTKTCEVCIVTEPAQRFLAAYGPIVSHFRPRRHRLLA